jgi:DNA polymerase
MGNPTGWLARSGAGALNDALRYLHELDWDVLYRREPRAAVPEDSAAVTAGPAPRAEAPAIEVVADSRSPEERAQALALVAAEASGCERCELARGRTHVVFASGDPNADLMIIGEGPGAQEDRQGLPFVGPAGELLTRILLAIERTRDQVYIANIVKCRPPQNRDPRPEEVAACRSYLDQQIALVRPRVIVALGRVAAQTLLGNDYPVGRLRGTWWEVAGVPVRVTYHPAALLRDANLKRPTWEDMKIVRERLRETAPGPSTPGDPPPSRDALPSA